MFINMLESTYLPFVCVFSRCDNVSTLKNNIYEYGILWIAAHTINLVYGLLKLPSYADIII